MSHPVQEPEDVGGDPVCWLERVCPACGAFAGEAGSCPRCGVPLERD